MNNIDSFNLIVICITIISALKIIVEFVKFLIQRKDPPRPIRSFVDELVHQEIYYELGDSEPYFKRLYKRTWNDGEIEYVTSED